MKQVVAAVLAFGSNLGDREATILGSHRMLAEHPEIFSFEASSLYESVALTESGPSPETPAYLNGVATISTALEPEALLDFINGIESHYGRVRAERWGSRTLDIDIITYGGRVIHTERLTVPHPRAFERDFVLRPWLDLDPGAVLPGRGRVSQLLNDLDKTAS
ncbi:2-amino-4-hydroxy-6-hydroxymethyldihydropteridine diphosphokinase [Lysinibacter sp. HNR]|uniref:2-amino-4-hydroxy-6- hydroxymethyldihydropteridine diphosphokinase n=1 Tax=Lysinibacter sp. HNR TaxID=3031408 RepID=UPI002434EDD8|nr:2-amino-4-hydroxy-6-hydroxymethyldihydropteridine diphosphokinase [Lysinibacter sp. HNR]WGD36811.1 2-amino-4-hydroxy-6-hydroxymethyldihydropteridine diphosphokinase [Lysinibacter sp. HNR]